MKKQLISAALAVFATYPDAEAVLVCEDGNVFLPERRNLAENHCREQKLPAPVEVTKESAEAWQKTLEKGQEIIDQAKGRKATEAAAEAGAKEAEEKAAAEAAAKADREAEERAQDEAELAAAAEAAARQADEQAAAEASAKEAEERAAAEAAQSSGSGKGGRKGAAK